MKLKFTVALILPLVLLSACKEERNAEWYMSHHQELLEKYTDCQAKHDRRSPECITAEKAVWMAKDAPDISDFLRRQHDEWRKQQKNAPTSLSLD